MESTTRIKGFSFKKGDANYFPDCVRDFWADTGLSTDISDLETIINWFDGYRERSVSGQDKLEEGKENLNKNTKFYTFCQNNSGGKWRTDENEGIGQVVMIEAESADFANLKAQQIGIYFDGVSDGSDCDCCGDRWSRVLESEWDSEKYLDSAVSHFRDSYYRKNYQVYAHFLNGGFRKVDLNADSN